MDDFNGSSLPDLVRPQERRHHHRHRPRSLPARLIRRVNRRLHKLNWKIVLLVTLGMIATVVMAILILTMHARRQVEESWIRLNRVLDTVNTTPGTELTLSDFERLQVSAQDLSANLTRAERQVFFLRPFSFLKADFEVTLKSLDAAQELTLAANDMLTGMQPTLFFLTQDEANETVVPQLSSGERIVELLSLGRNRFWNASGHLNAARTIIDGLDRASISSDLLVTVDGLVRYHDQLEEINSLLLDSPTLLTSVLGLQDTQTYLILSQNSDELRPSGGYISTYGWMTVRSGRLLDYNYSPTTVTSPNPPPATMADQIAIPSWWIQYDQPIYAAWDSSWYADFPSTAAMAAWYYDNGGNPEAPVDGVIAIDIIGFQYILEGLGSVTVPGYDEIVTPENFRDAVYRIRAEGEGELPHKQFIAAMYRQILSDWQTVDQQRSTQVRGAVLRALQEKHIMVYFTDETLNQAVDVLGWSGKQDAATGHDYLMVADANLGNKSNTSIVRQITYDVEIEPDGSLRSRTAVAYDYSARVAELDPAVRPAHYADIDYHNIVQVFVPANSSLIGTNNLSFDPETVTSNAHTAFVALVQVDYNQTQRFQFSYTAPVLVERFGPYRRYKLLLQKQPGMKGELVNVQVTLPENATAISVLPAAAASYQLERPILEFRVELITDEWIEIIYSQ